MINDELAACCKQLKLSQNIVDNSLKVTAETNQEYLYKILQLEIDHRYQMKCAKLIKKAGFYTLKSFDGYRFEEVTFPKGVDIAYLKETRFIEEHKNLILYGNVGTGKTHLATAIGITACKRGLKVGFYRTANLVNQLAEAKKAGKLPKLLSYIHKLDLLICDEWGYVPMDREASQILFQVISDSYERRSVILTTNLEFSRWIGVFYDEQMTAAIIVRLVHHSYLLLYDGPSYRMRDSLMRTEE